MRDAVATMGTILPDDVGGRDAVHVAVLSVVAGDTLKPGQDIGLSKDRTGPGGEYITSDDDPIGIVDPFLKKLVEPDERFWLYLYPRTITGLRHNWTHPNFPDSDEYRTSSERWLRDYAENLNIGYRTLMEGAHDYLQYDDYLNQGETLQGESTSPEFWEHFERVTGKAVPHDKRENFFTCSC